MGGANMKFIIISGSTTNINVQEKYFEKPIRIERRNQDVFHVRKFTELICQGEHIIPFVGYMEIRGVFGYPLFCLTRILPIANCPPQLPLPHLHIFKLIVNVDERTPSDLPTCRRE